MIKKKIFKLIILLILIAVITISAYIFWRPRFKADNIFNFIPANTSHTAHFEPKWLEENLFKDAKIFFLLQTSVLPAEFRNKTVEVLFFITEKSLPGYIIKSKFKDNFLLGDAFGFAGSYNGRDIYINKKTAEQAYYAWFENDGILVRSSDFLEMRGIIDNSNIIGKTYSKLQKNEMGRLYINSADFTARMQESLQISFDFSSLFAGNPESFFIRLFMQKDKTIAFTITKELGGSDYIYKKGINDMFKGIALWIKSEGTGELLYSFFQSQNQVLKNLPFEDAQKIFNVLGVLDELIIMKGEENQPVIMVLKNSSFNQSEFERELSMGLGELFLRKEQRLLHGGIEVIELKIPDEAFAWTDQQAGQYKIRSIILGGSELAYYREGKNIWLSDSVDYLAKILDKMEHFNQLIELYGAIDFYYINSEVINAQLPINLYQDLLFWKDEDGKIYGHIY